MNTTYLLFDRARTAWKAFEANPNEENRKELRRAMTLLNEEVDQRERLMLAADVKGPKR